MFLQNISEVCQTALFHIQEDSTFHCKRSLQYQFMSCYAHSV
jgi:hypothetical protein